MVKGKNESPEAQSQPAKTPPLSQLKRAIKPLFNPAIGLNDYTKPGAVTPEKTWDVPGLGAKGEPRYKPPMPPAAPPDRPLERVIPQASAINAGGSAASEAPVVAGPVEKTSFDPFDVKKYYQGAQEKLSGALGTMKGPNVLDFLEAAASGWIGQGPAYLEKKAAFDERAARLAEQRAALEASMAGSAADYDKMMTMRKIDAEQAALERQANQTFAAGESAKDRASREKMNADEIAARSLLEAQSQDPMERWRQFQKAMAGQ